MNLPRSYQDEMLALLGKEEFEAYCSVIDERPKKGLRVNTLKITPEEFKKIAPGKLRAIPWISNGFYYEENDFEPSRHPFYYAGLYYLQEPSAMTPASRLPIEDGDRVLDVCAAPGGKSTELAAKLAGSGFLFSNDISLSRSRALLKNIELFGVRNAVVLSEDTNRLAERFPGFFDKILVDAPCSGEGMFRKEYRMVNAWKEHGPAYFAPIQREILKNAYKMLRPGGMLLYSTCTFSLKEDEENIAWFLKEYPKCRISDIVPYEGFSKGRTDLLTDAPEGIEKTVRIFPHKMEGEGHFLALIQKLDDGIRLPEEEKALKKKKRTGNFGHSQKLPKELISFLDTLSFTKEERERVTLFGQKALLIPKDCPDLSGLRILRCGLLLGECRKNRFEPSQALSISLKKGDYKQELHFALEDPRIIRFLRGETLELNADEEKQLKKGYVLIFVGDYPLGWGKFSGGMLKNKYLQGWRMNS